MSHEAPNFHTFGREDDIVQTLIGRGWRRGFDSLPRHINVQGKSQLLGFCEVIEDHSDVPIVIGTARGGLQAD